ncbi:hypothetical protein PYCC9005_004577 [Savitreella phatthalungensis]
MSPSQIAHSVKDRPYKDSGDAAQTPCGSSSATASGPLLQPVASRDASLARSILTHQSDSSISEQYEERGRKRERSWNSSLARDKQESLITSALGTPPRSKAGPAPAVVGIDTSHVTGVSEQRATDSLSSDKPARRGFSLVPPSGTFLSSMFSAATAFGSTVLGRESNGMADDMTSRDADNAEVRDDVNVLSLRDMGIPSPTGPSSHRDLTQHAASLEHMAGESGDVFDARKRLHVYRARSSSSRTGGSHRTRRRSSAGLSIAGTLDAYTRASRQLPRYAVASNKRNREFHATFRSVPEADYLLDDYGCALQREILIQGRMYVSEQNLCFNSNIFGWVTNLVVAFSDIVAIEKRSTAAIFPNAIQVSTGSAKHTFASFISRDTVYDLLVNIWRQGHPHVRSTPGGVQLAPAGAKVQDVDDMSDTESFNSSNNNSGSYNSDDASDQESGASSYRTSEAASSAPASPRQELEHAGASEEITPAARELSNHDQNAAAVTRHGPTQAPSLTDGTALKTEILDEIIDAPMPAVQALMASDDTTFMQSFLSDIAKLQDVKMSAYSHEGQTAKRTISYIKPLSGPVGPKQTRCLIDDAIEREEPGEYVQILQTTVSPDVPSGDAFTVKTRFCLMWGDHDDTRLVTQCDVVWSKSSWLKSVIEKGSISGQHEYSHSLVSALRNNCRVLEPMAEQRKARANGRRASAIMHKDGANERTQYTPVTPLSRSSHSTRSAGFLAHINVVWLMFAVVMGMLLIVLRTQASVNELDKKHELLQREHSRYAAAHVLSEELELWRWLSERDGHDSAISAPFAPNRIDLKDQHIRSQLEELIKQTDKRMKNLRDALDDGTKSSVR